MKDNIRLSVRGLEVNLDLEVDKMDAVSNIVGTGKAIVKFSRYRLDPIVEYCQSSGHGEIVCCECVYFDTKTRQFDLSEDPNITKKIS